jgi:hypothetical protein
VFVIDTKQWTGSVHQRADGLAWHHHYRLDWTLEMVRWEAEAVGRLLGTDITPLVCVHGAYVRGGRLHVQGVAIVLASQLRSGLGCDRVLSDAEVALLATTAWKRLFRPPDRPKCSGKNLEGQRGHAGRVVGCPWSPTAMAVRHACPVGRHGGSQHGKTTTDANHQNARQDAQAARWWVHHGQPVGVRPAQGQEGPGSGIQGDHGQAESLR